MFIYKPCNHEWLFVMNMNCKVLLFVHEFSLYVSQIDNIIILYSQQSSIVVYLDSQILTSKTVIFTKVEDE